MGSGIRTVLVLFLIGLGYTQARGQVICGECGSEYLLESKVDTLIIHDTVKIYISGLDDVTRTFGMSFDAFVKEFLLHKQEKDTSGIFSAESVYLNYMLPLWNGQKELAGKRVISAVFTFGVDERPRTDFLKPSDSLQVKNRDVIFRCGNNLLTDYFITSPYLVNTALVSLFRFIDEANGDNVAPRQINGINFVFPEFQFKQKRAMAQFAKSVSLITDSIRLKSIRDLSLYFSFDKTAGLENLDYLYSVSGMADSIFLIENGKLDPEIILTSKTAGSVPAFSKIVNQFYLARYFTGEFPVPRSGTFSSEEILLLSQADYPDNNWEGYLYTSLLLVVLILLAILLYWVIPGFSYYLNRNRDYMFILIIMLVFEIFLLLLSMTEAMSRESILNLDGKNRSLLLFMPLIFVFLIPVLKAVGGTRQKP